MSEKQWERFYYKTLSKYEFTKKDCGFSGHGLRHAYAQERYKNYTGFEPSAKFNSKAEFLSNAMSIAGESWSEKDKSIRSLLMAEMGHGGNRNDIISVYLGSYA